MPSKIYTAMRKGHIRFPQWIESNVHYECIGGSHAYGVHNENSDLDIIGIVIPPKRYIFPSTEGFVDGFDKDYPRFEQCQEHHSESGDFTVHNIVKFFRLAADGNPNIIDTLFVSDSCITHISAIGHLIRDNRKLFLSNKIIPRFRGYAASQFYKLRTRMNTPTENLKVKGKRLELIEKFGYDVKFAYHCMRLLSEVEQAITSYDIDLTLGNEEWKEIRRGEWSYERLRDEFCNRKITLESKLSKSVLPEVPDEKQIKNVLLECLERHYGSIKIVKPNKYFDKIEEIRRLIDT